METSLWAWGGFIAFVLVLIALDLGVVHRKPRAVKVSEALWTSLFYIMLAMVFATGVFYFRGDEDGWAFLTGFLIEKSLSIDNIFRLRPDLHPFRYRRNISTGCCSGASGRAGHARGADLAGVELIANFHWLVYVFGAFLVVTGIKMLMAADAEPDMENNRLIGFIKRRMRVTEEFHGERFFVRQNGALYATPLFLTLIVVEASDLVFAVDVDPGDPGGLAGCLHRLHRQCLRHPGPQGALFCPGGSCISSTI